jgi:hypothetical protein
MEHNCLFCLEPVKESTTLNPIGCQCAIHAHEACFHTWFQQKQQLECPICHTVSIPNPVPFDNIHIVYVQAPQERDMQRRVRNHEKAVAMCCCILLGWSIGLGILEVVFGKG